MSSLILSSCSEVSAVVAGVLGDPRRELESSAAPACCLAICPAMPTGGVAELARSLPLSNWAFSSAALLLIFVIGRGVGVVTVGELKCGGENYAIEMYLAYICNSGITLDVAQRLGRQQTATYLGICYIEEVILRKHPFIVESDLRLEIIIHNSFSIATFKLHYILLERKLWKILLSGRTSSKR